MQPSFQTQADGERWEAQAAVTVLLAMRECWSLQLRLKNPLSPLNSIPSTGLLNLRALLSLARTLDCYWQGSFKEKSLSESVADTNTVPEENSKELCPLTIAETINILLIIVTSQSTCIRLHIFLICLREQVYLFHVYSAPYLP